MTYGTVQKSETPLFISLKKHYAMFLLKLKKIALLSMEKKEHTKICWACAAVSCPVKPEINIYKWEAQGRSFVDHITRLYVLTSHTQAQKEDLAQCLGLKRKNTGEDMTTIADNSHTSSEDTSFTKFSSNTLSTHSQKSDSSACGGLKNNQCYKCSFTRCMQLHIFTREVSKSPNPT